MLRAALGVHSALGAAAGSRGSPGLHVRAAVRMVSGRGSSCCGCRLWQRLCCDVTGASLCVNGRVSDCLNGPGLTDGRTDPTWHRRMVTGCGRGSLWLTAAELLE